VTLTSVPGGVASTPGFVAGAAIAGLRSRPLPDLAMVAVRDGPGSAAAVFTTNRFPAAPIHVAREHLEANGGRIRGVVANAGCANAGTGPAGIADARRMAAAAAGELGCRPEDVLPVSTGLIGSRLRVDRIEAALPSLQLRAGRAAGTAAARAIMTTDTRPKEAAVRLELPDQEPILVAGMAKGSGMIHPQMATMLAFLTTDADASPDLLHGLLQGAVDSTFNQVTVDRDESTNDLVVLMASGRGDRVQLEADEWRTAALGEAVHAVCRSLAQQIAADGEGARRRIDVVVTGTGDDAEARRLARAVAGSNLVKAAVHGADPNWGRIAAAVGQHADTLDPACLRISIADQVVFDGAPLAFDERDASRALRRKVVNLGIDLQLGPGRGEAWGCDLSAEYVAINSEYRT